MRILKDHKIRADILILIVLLVLVANGQVSARVPASAGDISEIVTAGIFIGASPVVDLLIDGNGDDIYGALGTGLGGSSTANANPGDTIFFDITLDYPALGNPFGLSWSTPAGWEVLIGGSASPLIGVGSGDYILEVRVPFSATEGTFDIIINGWKRLGKYSEDSVTGRIVVSLPLYTVDALIDGDGDGFFGTTGSGDGGSSSQSTIAGQQVNFSIEFQNQSAAPDSYTVQWVPIPGWTALFDGSSAPFATPGVIGGGSEAYTFSVTPPLTAAEGDYSYIVDVRSTVDPTNVESVTALIHIGLPPVVDLVIDGDGADDMAPAGSGEGGTAIVFGDLWTLVTASLEIFNRGGLAGSFQISWQDPAGWPVGSVLISDGANDYTSPFVTPLIDPDGSLTYTMRVLIPAWAGLSTGIIIDAVSLLMDTEDSVILEIITASFISGIVFDDSDHDGIFDAGEDGWSGVTVTLTDPVTPYTAFTDGGGRYLFTVPSGLSRDVIELTPGGMVSLSPDTVQTGVMAAGDTVYIDFADVMISTIAPELSVTGTSGGFIELPHTITAGTAGQAAVNVALPAGWAAVWYRDVNGDGILDAFDTVLTAADLYLDPELPGYDIVPVIIRVFIPPEAAPGTVASAVVTLQQTFSGTSVVTAVLITDNIAVLASSSGMLVLVKTVDLAQAHPGDIITYTIDFSNPGTEGIMDIVIVDPIFPSVDLVLDAFGPGNDIEWIVGGVPVYLTADPVDADEALYDAVSGTLSIVFSRQAPFTLESGGTGSVSYQVRVR